MTEYLSSWCCFIYLNVMGVFPIKNMVFAIFIYEEICPPLVGNRIVKITSYILLYKLFWSNHFGVPFRKTCFIINVVILLQLKWNLTHNIKIISSTDNPQMLHALSLFNRSLTIGDYDLWIEILKKKSCFHSLLIIKNIIWLL